jgi:hypothetical protein
MAVNTETALYEFSSVFNSLEKHLLGSASLSVAILNERWASHTLSAWKVSQDGPLGSVYEFWVQNSFMANG